MESVFPDIWNVLHDGTIDRVEGNIPGDVRIQVDIEYLRERFDDAGELIIITLHQCSLFTFCEYDSDLVISSLPNISSSASTILNGELTGISNRVFTDTGILEICCVGISISLDSGRRLSRQDLLDTARAYWDEWKTR